MDIPEITRLVLALVFVLGLLALVVWLLRKTRIGGVIGAGGPRRLEIVEARALDTRTRLLLVRRDSTEHLIAVGPNGVAIIEAGIEGGVAGGGVQRAAPAPEGQP